MTPNELYMFLCHYIFPFQFAFGWAGNILNLIVLLSRAMRSKTNILLASMALADLAFLLFMVPSTATTHSGVNKNKQISFMLIKSADSFVALANWFSVASTWLVVTVSIERLMAIRNPLHVKTCWSGCRLQITITAIFVCSFIFTFHHNVAFDRSFNGSHWDVRPQHALYISIATIIQACVHVAGPLCILVFTNIGLVLSLRRRYKELLFVGSSSLQDSSHEQLRKVTVVVATIVTCFTLTNLPSMVVGLWTIASPKSTRTYTYWYTITVANSLVITGKVLNFFLFCTSSGHFRQQLLSVVCHRQPSQNPNRPTTVNRPSTTL